MGLSLRKLAENCASVTNVVNVLSNSRHRKRKRSEADDLSANGNDANESVSGKRKKLLTLTQYIHKELFIEQKNSDINILALGKVWKLHKVYLMQSPYFYSMFNGSWRESCESFVHIKMLDNRITLDSLNAVFGSMYSDEIDIEPQMSISILATATLFHLDSIIDKCIEVMNDTVNCETVIEYYETACQYGCQKVKKTAFNWLEINLLSIYNKHPELLRSISIKLMTDLISSPDLYVMQTEFSLYTLLRTWIYLRLNPNYKPETTYELHPHQEESEQQQQENNRMLEQQPQQLNTNLLYNSGVNTFQGAAGGTPGESLQAPVISPTDRINTYFSSEQPSTYDEQARHYNELHSSDCNCCFLCKPEGRQYLKPFQALRTQYLTNHDSDLNAILNDNIIPIEWIYKHVLGHWKSILKVDHLSTEEGVQDIDAETFQKCAMRCGRALPDTEYAKWRWTGFNFGIDLIVVVDGRILSIRRHHRSDHERLLTLQLRRRFMIKICVTSINSQRQPIYTQKLDITSLCMEKNEEISLMVLEPALVHPLLISVNMLMEHPMDQQFKQHINIYDGDNSNTATIPISDIDQNHEKSLSDVVVHHESSVPLAHSDLSLSESALLNGS